MTQDGAGARHASRARREHVQLTQFFEDARACHPRQHRSERRAERDRRQHQMRQRPAARYRQPPERDGKDDREQRPEPEIRHGNAGERQRGRRDVDDAPRRHRGNDAQGDRHDDGKTHRRDRQLDGRGHAVGDRLRDGRVGPERHAEISLANALEERPVLDVQRAIEAELRADPGNFLRRCALAEHRLDRIPRHEME